MVGHSTCRNAGRAPTNNNGTFQPIPAVSCAFTPALANISAPAQAFTPAPASTLGPPGRYTDNNLQRTTKLALKLFVKCQEHSQLQANFAPCKQPLKARFPDLYYRNSQLDCYCFCQ